MSKYREYLLGNAELMAALPELKGKDLVCWCALLSCHGDVLMELANEGVEMDKAFIIAFTGHRGRDLTDAQIETAHHEIWNLLNFGKNKYGSRLRVLSGMADGIDQLAASVCNELGIAWTACVPHKDYFAQYDVSDALLSSAAKVVYVVDHGPWNGKHNFTRNEYMLKWADVVVACAKFDATDINKIPSKGGTAHMCRKTHAAGKKVVHIQL